MGATVALIVTISRQAQPPVSTSALPQGGAPQASAALRMAASSEPEPPPSPKATPQPHAAAQVSAAVRRTVANATVGVEVYDRDSGTVLTSLNAERQFPAMSVAKLFIALDVLHQHNWKLPSASTQAQLTRMISYSDDSIASALWAANGGGAIIKRTAKLLGLTGTRPPAEPGEWGDTLTTPRDLVTTYTYLADRLPKADHDLLYSAMYNAPRTAADGFDQYFGIPSGLPGTTWAIKQGWGSSGNKAELNTTGLIGADSRYVLIVLVSAPMSSYSRLPTALTNGTAKLASLVSGA